MLRSRTDGSTPIVVDVRTPGEFARTHVAGARSMPLNTLNLAQVSSECRNTDGRIYLMCQGGSRAVTACEKLAEAGIADAYVIEGGMNAWVASGLPVVSTGRGPISLERQVRITAGSLVLLGFLLAWLVHPYFLGLSAFIGAGLVFAGVTDFCGMGILLSKMPWNNAAAAPTSTCRPCSR